MRGVPRTMALPVAAPGVEKRQRLRFVSGTVVPVWTL